MDLSWNCLAGYGTNISCLSLGVRVVLLNCLIEVRNYGDACLCDALNMNVWNASITA